MKRIVTLGTGTGQRTLLEALRDRQEEIDVTAVVGVTDNGGSSAAVRRAMGLPQPGDCRNCLGGLAPPSTLRDLVDYRFNEGELAGLSLGNLIVAALSRLKGDFGEAVQEAGRLLGLRGRVLPVTTKNTQIGAELATGWKIVGEWEIIRREPRVKIVDMFLLDPAPAYPPAVEALERADLVVIGPGTLLTGIVSVLLTTGIPDAIHRTQGEVVYVCNLMTQPGQTDGFTARDHVRTIEGVLGFPVDRILVNSAAVPLDLRDHYSRVDAEPVVDDLDTDLRTVRAPLLANMRLPDVVAHKRPDNVFLLRHDRDKLVTVILDLVRR
ncbi:MAG: YvcK family protein [Planctomycetes bacterium]|nr:YvcK family protein [Planctomycetota bacterium]